MAKARIVLALILSYMLFAMLLNSVGTVILQSIETFYISKSHASILEAFKDLTIAGVSFLVASFLPRLGFRRAIMLGLGLVALACVAMPLAPDFGTTQTLFAAIGAAFALVKVSVYSSIGLLTDGPRAHASLTNTIEGLFMVGALSSYWLFSAFINPLNPADPVWLDVYWVLAGLSVIVLLLLAVSPLDESKAQFSAKAPLVEMPRVMIGLIVRPLVLVFLASAFLYVLMEQGIGTWLPTFNREVLHLPSAMSIQAASIFAGSLALGRLAAGIVLRRLAWFPVLAGCIVAMAALVLATLPLTHGLSVRSDTNWLNAPLAAYIFPLIGLFLAPIYPAINSAILSALPKTYHAAMTGLIVVFSALGGTTGSLITGTVFQMLGGQTAFYLTLIPMALLMLTLWQLSRLSARPAA
ncbi:MAG: MFS transporter [Sphingomonadales bacterium]|nr:MAG: MFS transporter [Sphingomonadales bacterium]